MRVATRDYARPQRPKPTGRGRPPPRRAAPKAGASSALGLPLWAWMIVSLSLMVFGAAIYSVSRPATPMDMAPSSEAKAGKPAKTVEIPPKEPSRFAFYEMLPSYEVVVPDDVLNPPKPKPGEARANLPPDPVAAAAAAATASAAPPASTSSAEQAALQAAIAAEAANLPKPITAEDVKPLKKPKADVAAAPAASSKPEPTAQLARGEQFLIQVAAYRSRSDAEQRVAALALAGLAARIEQVTIDNKDTWYRVRLGPFGSAAAASAAQQSLKAQGFSGVVMKVKS